MLLLLSSPARTHPGYSGSCICRKPSPYFPVVADETALLVPQGDEQALSDAILQLLCDEALRTWLSAAGQRRAAELFDIHKQTVLLEEKYDGVLSQFSWSHEET